MNAFQFDRLAQEFGVISGPTLKAMLDGGMTAEYIAAACGAKPDHFAARLAWWESLEAPTSPAVITSDRIDG